MTCPFFYQLFAYGKSFDKDWLSLHGFVSGYSLALPLIKALQEPLSWLEKKLGVSKTDAQPDSLSRCTVHLGVVSSSLKVHGTANLRVADTSIIPLPIAAHIQATVYAISEKVRFLNCACASINELLYRPPT